MSNLDPPLTEEELSVFASIALKLVKAGAEDMKITTDNNVLIAVDLRVLGVIDG